jgi:PKD repeat protein
MASRLSAKGSHRAASPAVAVLILLLLLLAFSSHTVVADPVIQGHSSEPTVRILFPENATSLEVSATYTVNISATDENAISQVKIKIDGPESTRGWVTIVKIGEYYGFNWTVNTVGNYSITARAISITHRHADDTVDVEVVTNEQPPQPPTAAFNFTPSGPTVNESIVFDGSVSYDLDGTIVSYAWDFGDGTTAAETNPVTAHTFTEAGTYTVSLTVFDDNGLNATVKHDDVTVQKLTVTLVMNATPLTITANSSVTISGYVSPARSDGTVTISYRTEGTDWETLATIVTSTSGQFSYEWTLTLEGTYEFKAEWNGDANTQADESEIRSITVQKVASQQTTNDNADNNENDTPNNSNNNLTCVFSGLGITAAALTALAILFVKKRKA